MGEKGHSFGIVAKLALEMALSDSKLCRISTYTLMLAQSHCLAKAVLMVIILISSRSNIINDSLSETPFL